MTGGYWVLQYRTHSCDRWTVEFHGAEAECRKRARELESYDLVVQTWDMWGGGGRQETTCRTG